ncbi:MAG: hypothetical protein P1U70_28215 [Saprospiraceae bacterium]|nr:hypothetical protein [Saprospiraceae bacterium]
MEDFKKFIEINKPDERNSLFGSYDPINGSWNSLTLEKLYDAINLVNINESVPESVISQFNVAKNLAIYTWYSYSFHQISELKAYSCVEMALRAKFGKNKNGFKGLIKKSVSEGLIVDEGFIHNNSNLVNNKYSETLADIIPHLRNELAHGSTTLHPNSAATLQWCADFINQLYPMPVQVNQ